MTVLFRRFLFAAAVCALFFSCSRGRNSLLVDIPPTPVLTATSAFAVITNPYIPVRDNPFPDGVTVRHLRNGDVEAVVGRQSVPLPDGKSRVMWLKLTDGWIPAADTRVFALREQAETAAEILRK